MDFNSTSLNNFLVDYLEKKTNTTYSMPKLYIPKKTVHRKKIPDLKARWYVYFYYRNNATEKKKLHKYYVGINRIKTINERLKFGNQLIATFTEFLKEGFNPNYPKEYLTKLIDDGKSKDHVLTDNSNTLEVALNNALIVKKTSIKENTYSGYKQRVEGLLNWLYSNNMNNIALSDFTFEIALGYINHIRSTGISATSVDNVRRELSSIFEVLKKDRLIPENYFNEIVTEKSKPKRHKAFSTEQVKSIKEYLIKNDLNLYYFITVMMYCFLRNREAVNLKVGDIDLKNKVLSIETKTEKVSYKVLSDTVIDLFKNVYHIEKSPKEHYIFSQNAGVTGEWNAQVKTRLKTFSDSFNSVKKALDLDDNYTIYGFRHTIISDIYINLIKSGLNEREAIGKLMGITGHGTEVALRKYLRSIGGIIPKSSVSITTIDF